MTAPRVEIIITPSILEYEQLVSDLQVLRDRGAESNTAAIVASVHAAAAQAQPAAGDRGTQR